MYLCVYVRVRGHSCFPQINVASCDPIYNERLNLRVNDTQMRREELRVIRPRGCTCVCVTDKDKEECLYLRITLFPSLAVLHWPVGETVTVWVSTIV
jgi:hypothetical protein